MTPGSRTAATFLRAAIDARDTEEAIRANLNVGAEALRRTAEDCAADIALATTAIASAIVGGGKILLCGNGGSAADCQHMAAELVSRLTADFVRPGIPAIALTTDTSFLTAYANDVDFDGIFARQVDTLGQVGDVLIGITTSGRSRNVLRAVEHARQRGLTCIALTCAGGAVADLADISVRIPSDNTQHIQESHLAVEHIICHLLERRLYGSSDGAMVVNRAANHSTRDAAKAAV